MPRSPRLVAGSMHHRCPRPIQIGEAGHLFDGRMCDCSGDCIAAMIAAPDCSGDALAPEFCHIGLPPVRAAFPDALIVVYSAGPLHHASHGPPPPLRGGGCRIAFSRRVSVRGLRTTTHEKDSLPRHKEGAERRKAHPTRCRAAPPHVAMSRHVGRGCAPQTSVRSLRNSSASGARSPSGALLRLSPGL
jgi:hypothetical protein